MRGRLHWNSQSRAFIHLYLKVSFGIISFEEREKYITDGSYDGGVDGYYINSDNKTVYFIQAKFRTNEKNFKEKEILLEEILTMDINRILDGEKHDESGNEYNGKIKQLQREISETPDIARYSYKIVLLANLKEITPNKARQLTGGFPIEVFNHQICYEKLVFPIISGTFFNACDLNINIDLSNKNAGCKISYTVKTRVSECEITVLFVPTIEIAKVMLKYKNSILKFNPRSYLEMDGKNIHSAIRETILNSSTNEFALYNNGITMLSEETFINEKIGQKNRAQLTVKNPQIINGGQTSFTLSRIYEENKNNNPEAIFHEKEVLLKVITLKTNDSHENKLILIDEISTATNKQTPVINADKFSNEEIHKKLQAKIFERYGLLYERKRGEFSDGIQNKYISKSIIIERNHFLRIYYSSNGDLNRGVQKKLFQKNDLSKDVLTNDEKLDRFILGLKIFDRLAETRHPNQRVDASVYAQIYVYTSLNFQDYINNGFQNMEKNLQDFKLKWKDFLNFHIGRSPIKRKRKTNKLTGESEIVEIHKKRFQLNRIEEDIQAFYLKKHKNSEEIVQNT